MLGVEQTTFVKFFEVFIQAGAIVAVVLLYGREVLQNRDLMKKTIISFIPTAIVGFVLYKVIKDVFFEAQWLNLTVFFIMGVIFLIVEWGIKKDKLRLHKELEKLTYKDALLIGLCQSLAVIPGVSRAGSVIVGMMFMKFRRNESAKFSFILSIPTIVMASLYDLYKMRNSLDIQSNSGLLIVGTVVSFITAYIVMKWFIKYLQHHSLAAFGWYRLIVTFILILFRY